jgi:UDP-hydrolysing UDP-N-acetyl-D-glucosamine 2-epimerase
MDRIAAVTVSRADFGILSPILRALGDAGVRADIVTACRDFASIASTAHASDRFEASATVDALPTDDTPLAVAQATGRAISGFADAFHALRPEAVLLIGDRFETMSAATAAVMMALPIAHVHGGEITEGAIDDQVRHAITKMSHLHFVSAEKQAARVMQMGEEPWRVTVAGAPGLDNLLSASLWDRPRIEQAIGMPMVDAPLLVTYHPETLGSLDTASQIEELIAALDPQPLPIVVTAPNVDAGNRVVRERLQAWARGRANTVFVENLGVIGYWSVMARAAAMVGNSSSGIIEAASVGLPVVDIGDRQRGRDRGANVVHADHSRADIREAIARAVSPAFRASVQDMRNPYGDGRAGPRIARVLKNAAVDRTLLTKRFHVNSDRHQAD